MARQLLVADDLQGPIVETPAGCFQAGDRIICRHNDRVLGVDNGTRGTVAYASPGARRLIIAPTSVAA